MPGPTAYESIKKDLEEDIIKHARILYSTTYPIESIWNVVFHKGPHSNFQAFLVVQPRNKGVCGHINTDWSYPCATKNEALEELLEKLQAGLEIV